MSFQLAGVAQSWYLSVMDYDLCVIGGGVNGCGIARDAAGRGLKVLLVEALDLASATSSASTKLIHGGLRYLEHYEFRLVKESLRERETLLNAAPHIIWPLDFVLPHDNNLRPYWMIKAGLFLYDQLSGRFNNTQKLKKSEALDFSDNALADPLIDDYQRGFLYSDCWVEDSRLVVLNAVDAFERGATVMPQTACMDFKPSSDRKTWQVNLKNMLNDDEFSISAGMVINAAGPWVRSLLDGSNITQTQQEYTPNVKLVKGSHIVVPKLYEGKQTFILQQPDKRITFAIPYETHYTLIGTTDVVHEDDPSNVTIDKDEIEYLCAAVNRSFKNKITPENIVWSYSGVRSLVDDGEKNASKVTRDYKLYVDERYGPPLLSVFGGKITTYRKLAEHVMERVSTFYPNKELRPWTENAVLPGGDIDGGDFEAFVQTQCDQYSSLPPQLIYRYARAYGSRMEGILNGAKDVKELGTHYGDNIFEAEIEYLIKYEFAHTLDDILWRRSKLGLHISEQTYQHLQHSFSGILTSANKDTDRYENAAA
jgi:glycerol-3-phosphate dehydrogenase